jgi:hypothetical protein
MMDIPLSASCGIDFPDRKLDRSTSDFRICVCLIEQQRSCCAISRYFLP